MWGVGVEVAALKADAILEGEGGQLSWGGPAKSPRWDVPGTTENSEDAVRRWAEGSAGDQCTQLATSGLQLPHSGRTFRQLHAPLAGSARDQGPRSLSFNFPHRISFLLALS